MTTLTARVPLPGPAPLAEPTGEHEFEAAPGLPEPLPAGERVLWQGRPQWRTVAREALHWRKLALYFAVLLAWRGASVASDGASLVEVLVAIAVVAPLPLAALGVVGLLARLIERTTLYTITDRRVVLRIGIVLTLSFNVPYRQIESAGLHTNADGSGDIALALAEDQRIAYVHLWPHARPWHVTRTQPALRALPQAKEVAQLLPRAWAAAR